jgi:hypothetical protein
MRPVNGLDILSFLDMMVMRYLSGNRAMNYQGPSKYNFNVWLFGLGEGEGVRVNPTLLGL